MLYPRVAGKMVNAAREEMVPADLANGLTQGGGAPI
jgi:hypothetical protein